jgi:hypothetical protein
MYFLDSLQDLFQSLGNRQVTVIGGHPQSKIACGKLVCLLFQDRCFDLLIDPNISVYSGPKSSHFFSKK